MDLPRLEKRIAALERLSSRLRLGKTPNTATDQQRQLEDLMCEVELIKGEAHLAGDHRTALACVRECSRIVELQAKVRGNLDLGKKLNIVNVDLDPETARRIAETFLQRRREESK